MTTQVEPHLPTRTCLLALPVRGSSMAFIVEFTSGETTEFDDRARYTLDDSGVLHITTPDERLVYAPHTWARLVEKHDPRQPSTRFV